MDPIDFVGASWCGYTQKMRARIESSEHADRFRMLDCAGEHEGHAACANVKGFPTFKTRGVTCHIGYSDDVDAIVAKCSP